ncbi:hypothetical protein RQP46_009343 [Phenoliferia psychrophenolica]
MPKSGNGYKEADRSLYPLWHEVHAKGGLTTFRQLEATLDPLQTHAWTAIGEYLLTGRVSRLDDLTEEDKAALLFLRVHAVGGKYAEKFVALGARTLEDLADTSLIKLSRAQTIGLRHFKDIELLIPRSEMDSLREALESAVRAADPDFECEILGSYRRQATFSSDIDLVVRHKKVKGDDQDASKVFLLKVLDVLEERQLILKEDQLTSGAKKYSGLVKLPAHKHFRRIDVRLAPYDAYPYMQLGSTGDALLMKLLRHTAKGKGWTLNEYGMGISYAKIDANPNGFMPDTLFKVKDEEAIFKKLGLPYLEPHQRDFVAWRTIYHRAGINLDYVEKL